MTNPRVPYSPEMSGDDETPPPSPRRPPLTWAPQRMVQWFDPTQLAHTGVRALLSTIFGAYADQREIQAALSHEERPTIHDYSGEGDLWVDYTADLGDGFDSTYTVAWLLGQSKLPRSGTGASAREKRDDEILSATQRGRVLVLGGDQVYPTASRSQYKNRFAGPYEAALPWVDEGTRPRMFAVPGNHDWYDGLTSFMRLFCQERWVGGWQTRQSRSYFAIKLPRRWWLLGIDIQLSSYVDEPQMNYFSRVAEEIQPGDHVILCTAQPAWVEGGENSTAYSNLAFFERNIICPRQAKLMLTLTGDLHHYARYTDSTGERHKITAGGGGAYLYGTQWLPESTELVKAEDSEEGSGATEHSKTYRRRAAYPEPAASTLLRWGALRLGLKNPGFVFFLAVLYIVCGWLLQSATRTYLPTQDLMQWLSGQPFSQVATVFGVLLQVTFQVPVLAVIAAFIVFSLYKFCEPDPGRPPWFRWFGAVHGLAHLTLILLLTWGFAHLNASFLGGQPLWVQGAAYIVEMLVIGGPAASVLFSLALLPGVNFNEAYSSQHIENYKNFIRFHVQESGALTIYPVGVDRVTRWEVDPAADPHEPYFRPRDGRPPRVHLIEDPITLAAPAAPRVLAHAIAKENR